MLTGESNPVFKAVSQPVLGGTVNKTVMLLVKVEKVGADTTLSRIIKLVEDAQANRAPVQAFADQISSVFVPAVLLIALLINSLRTFGLEYTSLPKSLISFLLKNAYL
jgi:Cu+-exporting ATPase